MATYKGVQIPDGMSSKDLASFKASIDMAYPAQTDTPKGQSGTIDRNAPTNTAPMLDTPKGVGGTINRNTGTLTSSANPAASPQGFGLGGFKDAPAKTSLVDFANAITQATNLAKQKRNSSMLGMMMPHQGTAMASDFSGILSNMNQASTNYSSELTQNAMKAAEVPQYTYGTATDNAGNLFQVQYDGQGRMIGQQLLSAAAPEEGRGPLEVSPGATLFDTKTGQPIYTAPTAAMTTGSNQAPAQSGGGGGATSGGGSTGMTSKQVTALKNALNASKFEGDEADGKYADPNLYLQNYQSWIASGGSQEEFFRMFPPSTYINPANTWMPAEIMKFTKKASSSTGGGGDDYSDL